MLKREMKPMRLLAACCVAVMALSGCVSNPNRGLSRTTLENRAKMKEKMPSYQILEGSLGVSGEGFVFENKRFRFEFKKELVEVDGYRTEEDRRARGLTASKELNSSYEFVRKLFGVAAPRTIRVVIQEKWPSPSVPAYVSWSSAEGIVMYFAVDSFQDRSILAHEMAHALISRFQIPTWMNEGIATLVEVDHAKSKRGDMKLPSPLLLNPDGYNAVQTWRSHEAVENEYSEIAMYRASYGIIKDALRRFGNDVFLKFFQQLDAEKRGLGELTLQDIIERINRAAGRQDAQAFFEEMKFRLE